MMESIKKIFHKENFIPILGPCSLVFAIPLLIPGLTLTLVALSDETGFAKYSALHVVGIVLLICSALLLVLGLILNCSISKKAKRRVSPLDEESMHSSFSEDMVGHVHSTHNTKPTLSPHPDPGSKKPPSLSEYEGHVASPTNRQEEKLQSACATPQSPSSSLFPGLSPEKSNVNAPTAAAALETFAARQSKDMKSERKEDVTSGNHSVKNGEESKTKTTRGFNFMASDSEDENKSRQYAMAAQILMTDRHGRIRTMSTFSQSSSSSSEDLQKYSEPEYNAQSLNDRDKIRHAIEQSVSDQEMEITSERNREVIRARVVERKEYTTGSQSSDEDDYSPEIETKPNQTQGPDNKGNAGRLFVTRQQSVEQRFQEANVAETENIRVKSSSLQTSSVPESSSNSTMTNSPSHGTYSIKSFVSEDIAVRASPEGKSFHEDDAGIPAHLSPAVYDPEANRSFSPVPLKQETSESQRGDQMVTFMGSKSTSSLHSSPGKHSRSHSVLFDSKGNDTTTQLVETDSGKKKKKKKQKRNRHERLDNEERNNEDIEGIEKRVDVCERRKDNRLSPIKSIMHPHHHPDHHVHWTEDDQAS